MIPGRSLQDFLVELHAKLLLQKTRVKSRCGTYSWEVNEITPAGRKQLADNAPLMIQVSCPGGHVDVSSFACDVGLPVQLPPLLQAEEQKKEKRLQGQMEELAKAGIQATAIPKAELDAGHGQVAHDTVFDFCADMPRMLCVRRNVHGARLTQRGRYFRRT